MKKINEKTTKRCKKNEKTRRFDKKKLIFHSKPKRKTPKKPEQSKSTSGGRPLADAAALMHGQD